MYVFRSKDDTTEYFTKYLVDTAPGKIELMRSDGWGGGVEG